MTRTKLVVFEDTDFQKIKRKAEKEQRSVSSFIRYYSIKASEEE